MSAITNKYPYTVAQWNRLNAAQQTVIHAVAEYLTSSVLPEAGLSDELLSETFNLLKPCRGCVPEEEVDEQLTMAIRRKFAAVYQTATELAALQLSEQGFRPYEDFSFCLVMEPSWEDVTHIILTDWNKPACYLHEWSKAWHFHFATLDDLVSDVLRITEKVLHQALATIRLRHSSG